MQTKHENTLQTIYNTQIAVGFIFTFLGTLLIAVMSTDAPGTSSGNAFWSTVFAFTILFSITISLPAAALKELKNYKEDKKLYFNAFNTIAIMILFFPLALWQLYLLYRIYKTYGKTEKIRKQLRKQKQSENRKIDLDSYIEKSFEEMGLALTTY